MQHLAAARPSLSLYLCVSDRRRATPSSRVHTISGQPTTPASQLSECATTSVPVVKPADDGGSGDDATCPGEPWSTTKFIINMHGTRSVPGPHESAPAKTCPALPKTSTSTHTLTATRWGFNRTVFGGGSEVVLGLQCARSRSLF